MKRFKTGILSWVPVTVLICFLLTAQIAEAAPASSAVWNLISSWSTGGGSSLNAVAAISQSDVWAVGWEGSSDSFTTLTLTEHWDGMTWNLVPSANVKALDQKLSGVAAASTNDIWAVGYHSNTGSDRHVLIEHWDGTSWSIISSPAGNQQLQAVAAISASNVWAVGDSINQNTGNTRTLVEHWNGTSWSIVKSPDVGTSINVLYAVAAISSNDIWAVGSQSNSAFGPDKTLTEHWNGTSWSVVKSPNMGSGDNDLYGLTAVSTNNVWAVGSRCLVSSCFSGGTEQTLTEHWNGSSWSVVSSPNIGTKSNFLAAVAAVSGSNIWAVGYSCTTNKCFNSGITSTLIEQWNGSSWSVVSSPNFGTKDNLLNSVATVPGSIQAWAVGTYFDDEGDPHPLTELYCC